jgi:hypothetical protein
MSAAAPPGADSRAALTLVPAGQPAVPEFAPLDRNALAARIEQQAASLLDLARSLREDAVVAPATRPPHREALDRHVFAEDDWRGALESTYRDRRRRDRIFEDPTLFGEPAWDMLLDLTVSELSGRKLSVTSACIGACVPSTTALRWLSVLEQRGLVQRENDARDGRRAFIRISPDGFRKMIAWLSEPQRADKA